MAPPLNATRSTTADPKVMPFLDHLAELRSCLLRVISAVFLGSFLSYPWTGEFFIWLTHPIRQPGFQVEIIGTGPAEAFVVKLKLAIAAGIIISLPYSLYQLWLFIAPGLTEKEKKSSVPFVATGTIFFLFGAAFCYFAVFPVAFSFFLAEYASIQVAAAIRMNEYLSFMLKTLLVFGIVFELPVISYMLARLRILSSAWLKAKARIIIVGIFITAAIFTPPDVVSQLLLAVPLLIICFFCFIICRIVETRHAQQH